MKFEIVNGNPLALSPVDDGIFEIKWGNCQKLLMSDYAVKWMSPDRRVYHYQVYQYESKKVHSATIYLNRIGDICEIVTVTCGTYGFHKKDNLLIEEMYSAETTRADYSIRKENFPTPHQMMLSDLDDEIYQLTHISENDGR